MVACHGGIKKIGNKPPVAVFGLSGSGKSSITNSHDHAGTLKADEKVTVIHDDAFLIDLENDFTVALEPSLFDKTDAVEFQDPIIKYFYSAQNIAVTELPNGSKKIVCADIRNGQPCRFLRKAWYGNLAAERHESSSYLQGQFCRSCRSHGRIPEHHACKRSREC
jgi:uncharacterized protein YgiM (DUF1202 family)